MQKLLKIILLNDNIIFLSLFLFLIVLVIMEDLKLIQKCIDWNLGCFWEIYNKYIDSIYKFVYLKTSNREVAEDIVSDVFMSALNNVWSFKIDWNSSVKSWLYRIANNKVIDFYRTNKQTDDIWDYLDYWITKDISNDIDDKDKLKEVLSYLDTVKKVHRDIVIYRIWEDLSYKEISDLTWLSVDNCK